jgi:hypothetical protein
VPAETSSHKLPYPLEGDSADVPRDVKALALRLDDQLDKIAPKQIIGGSAGKLLIVDKTGATAFCAMKGDGTIDAEGNLQLAPVTSQKLKPTMGTKMLQANYTLTNSATALTMQGGALEITPAVPSRLLVWSFWMPEYTKLESGSFFTGHIQSGGGEVIVELPAPEIRSPWALSLPGTLSATHVCLLPEAGKKYPIKMLASTASAADTGKLIAANTGFTYMLVAA